KPITCGKNAGNQNPLHSESKKHVERSTWRRMPSPLSFSKIRANNPTALLRSWLRFPHLRGKVGADRVGRGPNGIERKVGVSVGGLDTAKHHQLADNRQAQIAAGSGRSKGVPQVVNAHFSKAGTFADGVPRFFQVVPGPIWVRTCDHIVAGAWD